MPWLAGACAGALLLVLSPVLAAAPRASASGLTWTQSTWSGGAGQTAWSDAAAFSSAFNVVTSAPGQITLGQTMDNGTGRDGAITVTGDTNLNTQNLIAGRTCADGGDAVDYSLSSSAAAGSTSLTLTRAPSPGCLSVGDEILVIAMQAGATTDAGAVGRYETDVVAGLAGATIRLQTPLTNSYTTTDASGHAEAVMVQRVPNYTNVTIDAGATLTASRWNGATGGVLFFRASGTVTIDGSIDVSGLGYSGGRATAPSSSDVPASGGAGVLPASVQTAGNEDGGGGGVANETAHNDSSGGGGGGNGGAGGQGAAAGVGGGNQSGAGAAYGGDSLTSLLMGGGGGAGGGADSGCSNYSSPTPAVSGLPGGSGGAGGGIVVIGAGSIVNDGTVSANGATGTERPLNPYDPSASTFTNGNGWTGDPPCGGGGGGGAGGSVFLSAGTALNLAGGTLSATGAAGGAGVHWGGVGGGGGGGSVLLSTGSSAQLGTGAVTAGGGQPGTPVSGGATGVSGSTGTVEIWRPSSATMSGSTTPTYSAIVPSSYEPSGSLTSSIFDSGDAHGASWGTLSYLASVPSGAAVVVRVRTGTGATLAGAPAFSSCPALSSGSSLSSDPCVTAGDRYAQYQVELTGSGTSTPTLRDVAISYVPAPAPPPTPAVPPVLSSVSPVAGPSGTTITLSGAGFAGATGVTIGGVRATWQLLNGNEIVATVPALAGVPAGNALAVTVQASGLSASDPGGFLYENVPTVRDVTLRLGYDASSSAVPLAVTSSSSLLSVAVVDGPAHGVVRVSGTSVTYAPDPGFRGSDTFTYSATNAAGTSAKATVSITVGLLAVAVSPPGGVRPSGATSGVGAGGGTGGDVPALRPRVRVLTLAPSFVPVVVTCEHAACAGTANVSVARRVLAGRAQVGWRHLILADGSFRVRANATVTLRLAKTALGVAVLTKELPFWLRQEQRYHLTLTVRIGRRVTHSPTYLRRR